MLRQVSSRNHRAKGGFRAKTALQMSTLVAVCIWLLYQMKYSHDHREAYEEKFNIGEKQSELTSFGRKDLFLLAGKEEVEPGEIKEKANRAEDSEQKLQIAEKKQSSPNGHEVEHSHEAREKSFKGDDASSEVVHNTEEVEHDERTREARERSFKADDASSAVGHVPVNDSEPEIGGFVSSLVREFNQTLPETLEKRNASSSGRTDKPGDEPSDLETVDHIKNETGVLKFHANESESQVELGFSSRDLSNSTVISKNSTQAQSNETTVVDPTISARDLQNQTPVPPLQASIDSAKLELPTSVKKSDDQNSKSMKQGYKGE